MDPKQSYNKYLLEKAKTAAYIGDDIKLAELTNQLKEDGNQLKNVWNELAETAAYGGQWNTILLIMSLAPKSERWWLNSIAKKAVLGGHKDILDNLIKLGRDYNSYKDIQDWNLTSLAVAAIKVDNLSLLEHILKIEGNRNIINEQKLAEKAVSMGNTEIINYLFHYSKFKNNIWRYDLLLPRAAKTGNILLFDYILDLYYQYRTDYTYFSDKVSISDLLASSSQSGNITIINEVLNMMTEAQNNKILLWEQALGSSKNEKIFNYLLYYVPHNYNLNWFYMLKWTVLTNNVRMFKYLLYSNPEFFRENVDKLNNYLRYHYGAQEFMLILNDFIMKKKSQDIVD